MTVKRLSDFFKLKQIPYLGRLSDNDSSSALYLDENFKDKAIAIDTASIIHKLLSFSVKTAIKQHIFQKTENGWDKPQDSIILELFKKNFKAYILALCNTGIIPYFVLDGKAPILKTETLKKRFNMKQDYKNKANESSTKELSEYRHFLANSYSPNNEHFTAVINILKLLDLYIIRASSEAEGVCAKLVEEGICYAAATEDYDIFMYGTKRIIRNLKRIKQNKFEIAYYLMSKTLFQLEFINENSTQEDYIKAKKRLQLLCILSGNDYTENIQKIGPGKIYKMFMEHNIHTYEEACKIEPRFEKIPYQTIVETLEKNKEYTIINKPK